jgi:hypothetical protein
MEKILSPPSRSSRETEQFDERLRLNMSARQVKLNIRL